MSHGSQRGGPALTTAALRAPAGRSSPAVLPQHGRAVPTAPRQGSSTRTVPRPYRTATVPYLLPAAGRARAGEQRRLLADYGRVLHEDAVGEALVSRQLQHLQPQLAP